MVLHAGRGREARKLDSLRANHPQDSSFSVNGVPQAAEAAGLRCHSLQSARSSASDDCRPIGTARTGGTISDKPPWALSHQHRVAKNNGSIVAQGGGLGNLISQVRRLHVRKEHNGTQRRRKERFTGSAADADECWLHLICETTVVSLRTKSSDSNCRVLGGFTTLHNRRFPWSPFASALRPSVGWPGQSCEAI